MANRLAVVCIHCGDEQCPNGINMCPQAIIDKADGKYPECVIVADGKKPKSRADFEEWPGE